MNNDPAPRRHVHVPTECHMINRYNIHTISRVRWRRFILDLCILKYCRTGKVREGDYIANTRTSLALAK